MRGPTASAPIPFALSCRADHTLRNSVRISDERCRPFCERHHFYHETRLVAYAVWFQATGLNSSDCQYSASGTVSVNAPEVKSSGPVTMLSGKRMKVPVGLQRDWSAAAHSREWVDRQKKRERRWRMLTCSSTLHNNDMCLCQKGKDRVRSAEKKKLVIERGTASHG